MVGIVFTCHAHAIEALAEGKELPRPSTAPVTADW
jgi:hypothetical protein